MLRCQRGEVLANGRGAGKRHQANLVVLDQIVGDLGRCTEHEVQYPRRQASVVQCPGNVKRTGRCLFGRLEND